MTMKIGTYQTLYESIQMFPDEDWYDSKSYESIQTKSKRFHDAIQHNLNQFMWIYSRKLWIDSLWYYSGKLWIDSLWCYSWKFDLIQKEWHKKNGHKECLIWINESWIESSNSRKDFPIHDNTQDIKESHDTTRHGLLGALTSF